MARALHLFELIKSLSPNEIHLLRRHFGSSGGAELPQYAVLFERMVDSEDYEEAALKKSLGIEGEGTAFSVLKNYLYQKILKSIGEEEYQNPGARVARLEAESEVLLRKKLPSQAFIKLKKAFSICLKYEYFFRAADLQNQLLLLHSRAPELKVVKWLSGQPSAKELIQKANELLEIRRQRLSLDDLIRSSASQPSPGLRVLSDLPEWQLIFQPEQLHSTTAKINAIGLIGNYHSVMGHTEAAFKARLELHRLYLEAPHLRLEAINSYAGNLFNLISSTIKQGKYSLAEELISNLAQVAGERKFSRNQQFLTLIRFQLIHSRCYLFLVSGKGEKPEALLKAIREVPRTNRVTLPDYYFVVLFYGSMLAAKMGDFPTSLEFMREADSNFPMDHRVDVRACLGLLEWSLRLRRGETDFLEYRGRSIQRFLRAHFTADDPEIRLMKWIRFLQQNFPDREDEAEHQRTFFDSLNGAEISFDRKWTLRMVAEFLLNSPN